MTFHRPPTTYIGKVTLKVADLQQMTQFYEEVIGFTVLANNDQVVSLTADGTTTLLELKQLEHVEDKNRQRAGLFHFALLLPERKDLANIVRHFIEKGIRFNAGDHLVSEALYLSDPEGNGIEVYADRPSVNWIWQGEEVQMTTEQVDFENLLTELAGKGWQGLPVQTVMGHLHLQVSELNTNARFYMDGIGFQLVSRYGNQALFLSDNKYHHHLAFNTWAGLGIPNATENMVGLECYTIIFPDEATRMKTIEQLQKRSITVEKVADSYVTYDSSNIRVELDVYR